MIGEWVPPEVEDAKIEGPPRNNPIVGHIVQRLFDIVHPPTVSTMWVDIIAIQIFLDKLSMACK